MKRSEFLETLRWRQPPIKSYIDRFEDWEIPAVVETDEGEIIFVGDVNDMNGTCNCCQECYRIKRWAYLFAEQDEKYDALGWPQRGGKRGAVLDPEDKKRSG